MRTATAALLAAALLAVPPAHAQTPAAGQAVAPRPGGTVEAIRARDTLRCGVQGPTNPGFGAPDSQGVWRGFNVDLCRAVAATVLGDAEKIAIVPLSTQARFPALQSGEIDVATNSTTYTMQRETQLGFSYAAVVFYDGQGIMVRKASGVDSATQLDGATICVPPGTTTELQLNDWFRAHRMKFNPIVMEAREELTRTYAVGRCDAITYDTTILFSQRSTLADPEAHVILSDRLSKEPLGIVVRKGDERFADMVRWSFYALVNAEELGVTRANVRDMLKNPDPQVRRLLGVDGGLGKGMGSTDDFAMRVISAVGNYGEVFERNLGKDSPMKIERGMNRLWKDGGILYAPPIR